MPPKDIEIILMRQLASCLAMPIFLVDPEGNLVFYNEHAERVLGKRFEETGMVPVELWSTMFRPFEEDGTVILPEALPLVRALHERVPCWRRFWIEGLDGVKRKIEVTAFPLISQSSNLVGAVSLLREVSP